ncbi:PTS system cellobiose-specific IIC component [Scopulibacillus darangshiensis]|uniref:Permease IIC component n=1 Tax=Scopulibacillus darangshiensis TaxID=442528 RepID=A0A4R2P839_9BACL|nr:PTS transporter subunit EIIC [Scopulibacillus darangshiensis]TCP30987.1 PTS system cellobiose-specific IIC component [Scopulibacillus darangshiensis]
MKENNYKNVTFKDKMMNVVTKLSENIYLTTLRDAFISTAPLTILASMFIFFNNVILDPENGLFSLWDTTKTIMGKYSGIMRLGDIITNATLNFLAVFIAFLIGYYLAQKKGKDAITTAIVSVTSLIVFMPLTVDIVPVGMKSSVTVNGVYTTTYTSVSGMFVAIIVAILSANLFMYFSKFGKLQVKLPDSVPEVVSRSFMSLIPYAITVTAVGLVAFGISLLDQGTLLDMINAVIGTPLRALVSNIYGITIYQVLVNSMFIFLGIHGGFITGPVDAILQLNILDNMQAIQKGLEPVNIISNDFIYVVTQIGGSGNLLGLIIAFFIVGRMKSHKIIAKIALVPALFNISEPLVFGIPLILNPLYLIPFALNIVVGLSVGYIATLIGLVDKISYLTPWTTPQLIRPILGSGGDFKWLIVSIALLVISILIYIPFVRLDEKIKLANQEKDIENRHTELLSTADEL